MTSLTPKPILIALPLVKQCEGLELNPYLCPANIPTIGYGHVILEHDSFNPPLTPNDAINLLIKDLSLFYNALLPLVNVPLKNHEAAALLSFIFNIGITAFKASTLRRKLNRGEDKTEVALEFPRWIYAKGKILNGLISRRQQEQILFLYPPNHTKSNPKQENGAGEGSRTLDINLGKVALYH